MTISEIIEVLIIERMCVERQDTPLCNRNCANCDLCLPTEKVVKAYECAIDELHQIKNIDCEWARMLDDPESIPKGILFEFSDGTRKRVQYTEEVIRKTV